MLFNSREFALFFPLATLLHFLVPVRAQALVLLLAGAVFYSAFIPAYLAVLALLIVVDYATGLWIVRLQGNARRAALTASVVSNLGILFVCKYYGFARMNVRREMFHGRRLFNASVTGGTLEDHVAIFGFHDAAGAAQAAIVLGLDPWVFNANHGFTRWRNLSRGYDRTCARLEIACSEAGGTLHWAWWTASRWWELLSRSYLQTSLATARKRQRHGIPVWDKDWAAPDELGANATLLTDGSRLRPPWSTRSVEETRAAAVRFGINPRPGLQGFAQIDEDRAVPLDSFAGALQRRGISLTLLLVPFHPRSWSRLVSSARNATLGGLEPRIRTWARERGIRVYGSYDAGVAGCDEAEFYDGSHPKETCLGRLLAAERVNGR